MEQTIKINLNSLNSEQQQRLMSVGCEFIGDGEAVQIDAADFDYIYSGDEDCD